MRAQSHSRLKIAVAAAAAVALGACGLGPGDERSGDGAELRVTRGFGAKQLAAHSEDKVREGQTVMRFLEANEEVETAYGGKFVQAIGGVEGGGSAGSDDWFYFVNGIEAGESAAEYELSPGDVVQWDYRDYSAAMRVPAIVGAWPEPFVHGIEGKRVPTRVECTERDGRACRVVRDRLDEQGVKVTGAAPGAPAGDQVLRVVVGKWADIDDVRAVGTIADGPGKSGVFARFRGGELELLDEGGRRVADAPAGSGLIGATSQPGQGPVFVVTGADDAGVERAAAALDERSLRNRFAVAATPAGVRALPVKEDGAR